MRKLSRAYMALAVLLAMPSVRLMAAEPDQSGNAIAKALKSKEGQVSKLPGTMSRTTGNPCAAYGPGFVRIAGSTTCVRASGSVQVDIGTQR